MKYTKISVKINQDDKPPYFIGSQIRGAFGYALKSVNENLFEEFFVKENAIHPYRFDVRLGQKSYEFSFYLFENACESIFDFVSAFGQMLMKIGLGYHKKLYNDFEIYINDKVLYKNSNFHSFDEWIKTYKTEKYEKNIILNFVTPLRIKKNNTFIKDDSLDLLDILNSIYQRKRAILGKSYKKMSHKPEFICKSKNIYFKELTRKSFSQNTFMQLGGLMGEMWIENLDKKSYKLLSLGELIGVGKQCVFGLGKINTGGIK